MKFERLISNVFHPLLLLPTASFVFLIMSGLELITSLFWISLWISISLIPTAVITYFTGRKKNFNVRDRSNRWKAFLTGITTLSVTLVIFWNLSAPLFVLKIGALAVVTGSIFAIANKFDKVSMHTGVLTCVSMLFLDISTPLSAVLMASSGLVGFSRIRLNCHTRKQVLEGGLLGVLCGVIFLLI